MHTVCHVIKRLEKLAVDHAYQIIQRGVCIRDTAEKGNVSFSHAGKIQFISIGQLGDLRQIEGCQPDTYTDQDGLGGLSRDKLSRTFSSNSQKIHKKGARSTVWLLTPRLIDYIFPFSRSLQRYA